jgi:hypothetical protein
MVGENQSSSEIDKQKEKTYLRPGEKDKITNHTNNKNPMKKYENYSKTPKPEAHKNKFRLQVQAQCSQISASFT